MAGVYVFDYEDEDIETTGLVGDLQPLECIFDEVKNGESLLTMRLCYDPLDKWKAVKVGNYIKALVPVRVPPKIVKNKYAQEVMTYKVKSSVTTYVYVWVSSGEVERPTGNPMIYPAFLIFRSAEKKKKVKVKRRIKAGATVQVLEQHDDGRCKVYLPGVGSGWTMIDNLEQDVSHTIPATFSGVESATTATRLAYQLFQVVAVEQTLDSVTVTARHVFYELANTYTTYRSTWPVEAHNAIDGIFDGLVSPDKRYTCLTDSSHKAGALNYERVNVVQALLDPEYGICAQYGLSLIRDNYDLYLLKEVGSDRGYVVEYGKNMLSLEHNEDISNVVTRIIPFGKNANGKIVYMDGTKWVDSPHLDEYAMPRVMYLDCSAVATESKTMTLAQVKSTLKTMAKAEFEAGCDLPELSMTVDFISLGDTEEYKQYRDLDKVYLYDRVTVKDKVRGHNYNAEVVAIRHNVLTGLLESVTLGSIRKGSGTRKIASWQVPEVDGGNIRLESIGAGVLAGGAVSEENMQDSSVSARAIVAYSVTADKIAVGAVTADKIDAGAVTAEKLAAGAITANAIDAKTIKTEHIATGAITAESGIIADSAINTAQIADGSITSAKIVSLNADVITSGTLATDRLLIRGENGLMYEINAEASGLTSEQLADEKFHDKLNGTVIVAESITAEQLAAESVTANKILAGAVTTDKLSASAVTADKIAAGAITTQKVSSDFGSSLDLSSNESINLAVRDYAPKTFVRHEAPTGTFRVGDVWIQLPPDSKWNDVSGKAWADLADVTWGEIAMTEPRTHVWDGTKWVLTVDYNAVVLNSTEIRQTSEKLELKANKDDPATGVETSKVTISADGVKIKTGGTFAVDSGNFELDESGNMSAQNAYLSGDVYTNGFPALSTNDIVTNTNAPEKPHGGMIWIKPDVSTIAQTTFTKAVSWGNRQNLVDNIRTGSMTGSATDAVGTLYSYRIRVPVYIREYSGGKTGAVLHFDVATVSGGTAVLAASRRVTIDEYGSGNKVIEMTLTSDEWIGNHRTLYFRLYATKLSGYYAYNMLNSSDTSASITLVCTSKASSGAEGWRDCAVYYYA